MRVPHSKQYMLCAIFMINNFLKDYFHLFSSLLVVFDDISRQYIPVMIILMTNFFDRNLEMFLPQ